LGRSWTRRFSNRRKVRGKCGNHSPSEFRLQIEVGCHSFYSRSGVRRTTPREVISFHVVKCREDNPSGSRCTSGCCCNCANPTCPFPRDTLRSDSNKVQFRNIEGQIVCTNCAVSYIKHGTWRSEATVSEAHAARSLRMRLVQPHNGSSIR